MGERLDLGCFQGWSGPGYEANDNADAGVRRRDRSPPKGGEIVMLERGQYRGHAGMIVSGSPNVFGFWEAQVFCGRHGTYQDVRPDDFRIMGHALRTPSGRLKRTKRYALLWQPTDGGHVMAGLRKHEVGT